MIPHSSTAPAGDADRRQPAVPAHARALAAQLSELFVADQRIVRRLNGAQRRLAAANDRLWSGLAPDAFGLIYDGIAPAGHSQIADLIKPATGVGGGPDAESAVLQALQDVHWQIHRAFCEYPSACEKRRQLAVEVGETSVQLTEALRAAGYSPQRARRANVHQLAEGTWPEVGSGESWR